MVKDCHNVLGCEGMPLGLSKFFLIGDMVSFALVAWVILQWHVAALRLLLLLGHVAASGCCWCWCFADRGIAA